MVNNKHKTNNVCRTLVVEKFGFIMGGLYLASKRSVGSVRTKNQKINYGCNCLSIQTLQEKWPVFPRGCVNLW